MRTLNVRLTVVLLVVVTLVVGSTHLLHSYQLQRSSSAFKNQALAAWNDSPRRELDAVNLMKAYLLIEPQDLDAREQLGFWYVDLGRFSAASATLEELVRTLEKQVPPDPPTIQRVREKLVVAAMAQGRCADAVSHLEMLRKDLPNNVDVLNRLGKCKVTLVRVEEAIRDFSQAIKLDPQRVDIYYNKAMALRFPPVQRLAEGEKCMAQMIAIPANAKSPGAHHVYGMWLEELEKYDEALKQAEAVLELTGDRPHPSELYLALRRVFLPFLGPWGHPGGLYLAAQCELHRKHFLDATKYAQRGIEAAPQDFAMYTLMADILVRTNARDKAIEILKNGTETIQSNAAKAQILWHLANLYLDTQITLEAQLAGDAKKNIDAAVDCMRRMREYHFSPIQLAFLDARVLYANDDWKAAREQFETVRPKLNDFPQLMKCLDYWIGYCYLQQGNPDQALVAFRRSLFFDKFYFKAHEGSAQVFLANGKIEDAVKEYQQAAVGNPTDPDAWMAFARMLVLWNLRRSPAEQNWDEVVRALRRAEGLNPLEGQVQLLLAEVLLARKKDKQAEGLLDSLRNDSPQNVEFCIAQASLAARQGKLNEAQRILNEPDEAEAKLILFANLAARQGWVEDVGWILDEADAAKTTPSDQVRIRLVQAVIELRKLGLEAGPAIEKLAANAEAFTSEEKTHLWNGLLSDLLEIKEYDRAKQLCLQIAREQPHDAMIRYRLVELALVTYDARDPAASLAELDRVLEEIDSIAGQGPLWMYGKAVRLMLEARQGEPKLLDAAMHYAEQARNLRLSWSRPYVLMGEICRQRGDDDEALEHYLRASLNGDRDLRFIRLLLQMLFQRQRYQDAEQVIRRLDSDRTTLTPEIAEKEAEIFAHWGGFDMALECAKRAYDPSSGDYRDHVWHGQVLTLLARRAQQEGHQDKLQAIADSAEESLRRACQIAPNAPDCRVQLVQLLVATKQMAKARIAASDAEEMIASRLDMGYIYEALGETAKARQNYEKAARNNPDLPRAIRMLADFYVRQRDLDRARPLIDRLLSGNVQAGEADLAGARRMKAAILVGEGFPKLKQATELIDRNLASPLATHQDKQIKVQLLLLDPYRARSPQLLELAESLVITGGAEPDPEDRFLLARLFLARGTWDRCREQMEKLVNGSQPSPGYLAAYVRMLLDHDELGDAEPCLDRLEKISPPGSMVALRAELMFRRKAWGKVPEFLAAYVGQEQAESLDRALLAGRLVEGLGGRLAPAQRNLAQTYFDKARQWYDSYVEKRPGSEMLLAGLDARHGKVEQALDRIKSYGEKSDPQQVVAVASAIIARAATTPEQLKQLESLVVALVDKAKRPVPLLFGLAKVQTALDRLQDSEAIYREILRKEPRDDLAANNLSMILALQKTSLDEALELIDKVIERSGPQGSFLDTRAIVLIARHEPQKALEDLAWALAEKSTPVRLFHKAWACLEAGNLAAARESLQAARAAGLENAMLTRPEREICRQIGKDENQATASR